MRNRALLPAAVVGALLVGGAATGTTLALFRDTATAGPGADTAGSIAVTVDGSTTATLGPIGSLALNVGATAGTAQAMTATLTNAAPTGAKNMRLLLHLDTVTSTNTNLTAGLEVAATTVATTAACPTPTGYKSLSAYTTTALGTTKVAPGGARKLCASVRVKGSATATVARQTGSLIFTFRGAQVRP